MIGIQEQMMSYVRELADALPIIMLVFVFGVAHAETDSEKMNRVCRHIEPDAGQPKALAFCLKQVEKLVTGGKSLGPEPAIGMTTAQVLSQTYWGRWSDILRRPQIIRTTTAAGVQEQWVFGGGDFLYFDNGILTKIIQTQ